MVIQGKWIARQAGVLKYIRQTLKTLEKDICELELEYYRSGNGALLSQIRSKLSGFEEEAQREVKYLGRNAQARRYGEGDRPGKTLVALLKPPRTTDYIVVMLDTEQQTVRGTQAIKAHVMDFNSKLYTSKCTQEADNLQSYFDTIELLWLENAHRAYLDAPFSEEDVIQVINSLPPDKAPGLDGLPTSFYKCYAAILVPHLMEVYQEAIDTGILPPTLREAGILLLLKPDKPPHYCDSYRQLSLINTDNKIYAKILANLVQPLLPLIARPDQSRFIPGRSTAHNLRTFFAILHYLDPQFPAVAAFLDATKAFDSLEWTFLFAVIQRLGFSPLFIKQIRLLYTEPHGTISYHPRHETRLSSFPLAVCNSDGTLSCMPAATPCGKWTNFHI